VRVRAQVQQLRRVWPAIAISVLAASTIVLLAVVGPVLFPKSYKVATWYATTPAAGSLTSGTGLLGGQTNADGSACFWLGSGEDRAALLWPPGYSARANPLSIFDEKGQMIATVGEVVTLDGGVAPENVIAKSVFGCPKTPLVREVDKQPFAP
jgi:hypothetical protein